MRPSAMASAVIGRPALAATSRRSPERTFAAQTPPSESPATTTVPSASAATRVTSALSSKPISIACLPIGPSAPANGQTTTPLAPEVAIRRPPSRKTRLFTLAG